MIWLRYVLHADVPSYEAKGWKVWGTEGEAVVLVWLHDEVPA